MSEISLKDLFLLNLKDHPYVMLDISESKKDLEAIHTQFDQTVPNGDWSIVQSQLLEHIEKLLDVPLNSILVNGWNKLREVRIVIEQQKKSGKQTPKFVQLYDHKITSTHKPKLQFLMNQDIVQTFPFDIELQLKISALELEIREGMIQKIMAGQCAGEGAISYMGAKLHEQKFLKFSLPGKVNLNPKRNKQHTLDSGSAESLTTITIQAPSKSWLLYLAVGLLLLIAAFLSWWLLY